ncbi:hypothetical protein NSA56_01680 [Oceanobacillus caeni]|uniref:hypothetical protein n=1 Tax=Oceanobacillus caeni TaxID=405946 RepID=UPI00214A0E51|nr:hypothetical protein [Oceanobacillus caeni]MCR1833106.1 hypothetical protein [Oceanobacillus caeni]
MQKNYRDYTVGELLDMGLGVNISNHNASSKEEAVKFLSKFEGLKRSSHTVKASRGYEFDVVRGWKGDFEFNNFIR